MKKMIAILSILLSLVLILLSCAQPSEQKVGHERSLSNIIEMAKMGLIERIDVDETVKPGRVFLFVSDVNGHAYHSFISPDPSLLMIFHREDIPIESIEIVVWSRSKVDPVVPSDLPLISISEAIYMIRDGMAEISEVYDNILILTDLTSGERFRTVKESSLSIEQLREIVGIPTAKLESIELIWEAIGPPPPRSYGISEIIIDPQNPDLIEVQEILGMGSSKLWRTEDGGQSWTWEIETTEVITWPEGVPQPSARYVTGDPVPREVIYNLPYSSYFPEYDSSYRSMLVRSGEPYLSLQLQFSRDPNNSKNLLAALHPMWWEMGEDFGIDPELKEPTPFYELPEISEKIDSELKEAMVFYEILVKVDSGSIYTYPAQRLFLSFNDGESWFQVNLPPKSSTALPIRLVSYGNQLRIYLAGEEVWRANLSLPI